MNIKAIYQKYGDLVFSLAVPHLLECGKTSLAQMDVEKEAAKILAAYPNGENDPTPMVSPDLKVEVLCCAAELAGLDTIEILKYIQTDMRLRGVTVNVGKMVSFTEKNSRKEVATVFLRNELNTSEKDRLKDTIRGKLLPGLNTPAGAVEEALTELGVSWDYAAPDYEIVF